MLSFMRYRARVVKLEEYRRTRRPPSHVLSVVFQPWEEPDRERWLAGLTCPCGAVGCPELRIGALLPAKAPSAEAWQARVRQYASRKAKP